MNYLRIAVDAKSTNRKFILFYADYLQEAWLSEVFDNDTTKIIKQFRCKDTNDVHKVAAYISRSGTIVNLLNESTENCLHILEQRLENPIPHSPLQKLLQLFDGFLEKFPKPYFQ